MSIDAPVALCCIVYDGEDWGRWLRLERRLAIEVGARTSMAWTPFCRVVRGAGSCDHATLDGTGDNPSSRSRIAPVGVGQSGDQRGVPPRTAAVPNQGYKVGV